MHRFFQLLLLFQFSVIASFTFCLSVSAQNTRKKTITRIFWQDRESQKLSYADLSTTDKWHIKRGWVKGFPQPADNNQRLGPMTLKGTQLLVGAVGDENNQVVRIDSGVYQRPHGSHFHWEYTNQPQATLQQPVSSAFGIAATSSNSVFFSLASGGIAKADWNSTNEPSTSTFAGGKNGAIATVNDSVVYATWPDAEGENAGRVDVLNQSLNANRGVYKFNLPAGNINSAATANNKVFFAHQSGISWVPADTTLTQRDQNIPIANISNGSTDQLGAVPSSLTAEKNWILFTVSNPEGEASLGMINAATANPMVAKLGIPIENGLKLSKPKIKLSLGQRYAFLFQERSDAASEAQEKLVIVALDPNRDSNCNDARVASMVNIGTSKIDGEFGHHNVCFDDYGRFAIFTDPGDGIINIMTINDMTIRAKFRVGGTPDRIIAVGSPEHFH